MDLHAKDGALQFQNGDLAKANKTQEDKMYISRILRAPKGSFVLNPTLGVGLSRMLAGPFRPDEVKREIKVNLEADDFVTHEIFVGETGEIRINATRNAHS